MLPVARVLARRHWKMLILAAVLCFAAMPVARAQGDDGRPSIEVHNRDTYAAMPLKELSSRTIIEGPLAKTRIRYLAENNHAVRIEAAVNLHVPRDTVLTGFGYYYGKRFIPGKMYDNDEAWKIYRAVTSRGRDPGIMDRPSAQDYHAQIFPVEPKQDLRIVIDLVQMLDTDAEGAHFELPLTQGSARGGALKPLAVDAQVTVMDHGRGDLSSNAAQILQAAPSGSADGVESAEEVAVSGGAALRLAGRFLPQQNWRVTIKRETEGVARSVFSLMTGRREGFFALSITAPRDMRRPRIVLRSRPGTSLSMPTDFGQTEAWGRLHIVGRYTRPQTLYVSVYDETAGSRRRRRVLRMTVPLSGERVSDVGDNPAAALWADKRIDALQNAARRDFRDEIVRLSKRFVVVSRFTALLAIPQEELDHYRKVLAKQKVETNTQWTGGGGGDPYIAVKAPADARQVVAVFPNGDVKNLIYDETRGVWSGRFDIPWGTPSGEYRVTIIVVQKDGLRSRFVLVYENLLSAPQIDIPGGMLALRARPGEPVQIRVSGKGVRRAVAVAPWGERIDLAVGESGAWQGRLSVPAGWPKGQALVTVVLLDGAHNRTEVSLDLHVE